MKRDLTEQSGEPGYFGAGLTPEEDLDAAYFYTIRGTYHLIQMQKEGASISDDDINKGIEINAKKLGISVEKYREELEEIKKYEEKDNTESSNTTPQ